jgi:chromate transporter
MSEPLDARGGDANRGDRYWDLFVTFLRLGCTSFGGPIAHLGYFNAEFVRRRGWVDEDTFAQIVALCQFLPGPASSQVGMIVGLIRGGVLGAALAWIAFTLPSAIVLTAFAFGVTRIPGLARAPWIHGLLIAAVAVVALAVANMYRSLCRSNSLKTAAFVAAAIVLLLPANGFVQLFIIVLGAVYGRIFVKAAERKTNPIPTTGNVISALVCAVAYAGLLFWFPLTSRSASGPVRAIGAFYESGALVFGGGHVVLPLLQARVVLPGWISQSAFLEGYGAAQAVPGPLFTFAAYLGAAMHGPLHGIGGAAIALLSIYLPSFLLIAAILPFWNSLILNSAIAAAMQGVKAVVVGILIAALYSPVWVSAVRDPSDAAIAFVAFMLLYVWKAPPWLVVGSSALAAQILGIPMS